MTEPECQCSACVPVGYDDPTPPEPEPELAAPPPDALAALRDLVRVLRAIGGYLTQPHQDALARAEALLRQQKEIP